MTNDKSVLWFVDDGDVIAYRYMEHHPLKLVGSNAKRGQKVESSSKKTVNWTELTDQLSIHKDSQSHQQKTEL